MTWHLYMLRCSDGSIYTGITTDVERRIKEHGSGKGSKAVRGRRPVRLVYQQIFRSRSAALKREAEIKSWPRPKKLNYLAGRKQAPKPRGPGRAQRPEACS